MAQDIAQRFDHAMVQLGPWPDTPRLAVALSGGPDSMVLLQLAQRWTEKRAGKLFAITVDHRLRQGSSLDVELAATRCRALGISHNVIPWKGAKPRSAVQEIARDARYRLMAVEAARLGVFYLLTGHQRDDQLETVFMRSKRPGTSFGLSGMTAARQLDDLWVMRPLLNVDKASLLEAARSFDIDYAQDPSNLSDRFERARIRKIDFDRDQIEQSGRQWAMARQQQGEAVAKALAERASLTKEAGLCLKLDGIAEFDPALLASILKKCLTTVRGITTSPAMRSAATLAEKIIHEPSGRVTLGGCVVEWNAQRLMVCREHGRIAQRSPITGSALIGFDDRFVFEPDDGVPPLLLAKAGTTASKPSFTALAKAALPALWSGERLVHELVPDQACDYGTLHFRPSRVLIEPPFVPI